MQENSTSWANVTLTGYLLFVSLVFVFWLRGLWKRGYFFLLLCKLLWIQWALISMLDPFPDKLPPPYGFQRIIYCNSQARQNRSTCRKPPAGLLRYREAAYNFPWSLLKHISGLLPNRKFLSGGFLRSRKTSLCLRTYSRCHQEAFLVTRRSEALQHESAPTLG